MLSTIRASAARTLLRKGGSVELLWNITVSPPASCCSPSPCFSTARQPQQQRGYVTAYFTTAGAGNRRNAHQSYQLQLSSQRAVKRAFSYTPSVRLRDFFPEPKDAPSIRKTRPAWPHPIYTEAQMNRIIVAHRQAKTWPDWFALGTVRLLRWGLDLATGYGHDSSKPFVMSERKYMIRNVFLESVAGVPGMVAGMLRHMRSMRRMTRDNGWIETLLEESYNERMHLLTFLKMAEPGLFMRAMVLATQGVFFNGFLLAYLISPRTCHRFVGYLEEEAVLSYTREIEDLDAGRLPKWEKMSAPQIAIDYWKMPQGKQTMRELLLYIRADEAKHREVNHTLGNLDQNKDPNPFVSEYKDCSKPHPGKDISNLKQLGWERNEVL